jgi:2-polyprenyl-3-methyl-5-hydroxy-6-metoxy-1,4-benzoquinol methylase
VSSEDVVRHDQQFWEDRYRSTDAVWSRRPNAVLVAEAADLVPATAVDVGCGEGADAMWLAEQGWRVTAVDWSATALERGTQQAATRGREVAGRISWQQADVTGWTPDGSYDLVTSCFLHIPPADRDPLFARLAAAVAPGGTLLLAGHHPSELETIGRDRPAELFFTPDEIVALLQETALAPAVWDVVTAEARPRDAHDHEGHPMHMADSVVRARRRA